MLNPQKLKKLQTAQIEAESNLRREIQENLTPILEQCKSVDEIIEIRKKLQKEIGFLDEIILNEFYMQQLTLNFAKQ